MTVATDSFMWSTNSLTSSCSKLLICIFLEGITALCLDYSDIAVIVVAANINIMGID